MTKEELILAINNMPPHDCTMWKQAYMDGHWSLYECVECGKQVKELPEDE